MRPFILATPLLLSQGLFAQVDTLPAAPTMQQTTQTLQANLIGLTHTQQRDEVHLDTTATPPRETSRNTITFQQTITAVSLQQCTLTIVMDTVASGTPASVITYQLPLSKLRSALWTTLEIPTRSTPETRVTETPATIARIAIETTDASISSTIQSLIDKSTTTETMQSFGIVVDDPIKGVVLLKALHRAANLCHAPTVLDSLE